MSNTLGVTGIILAGGASRRMGRNKASLPWGDTTLIEHVVETLSPVTNELLVVVKEASVLSQRFATNPWAGPRRDPTAVLPGPPIIVAGAGARRLSRRLCGRAKGTPAVPPAPQLMNGFLTGTSVPSRLS